MNIKEEFLKAYQNFIGATDTKSKEVDQVVNNNDGKIYDKSNLKISDLVVGGKVEIINVDKTLADAPDGDYTLSNGDILTVKGSLIESIAGQDKPTPVDDKKEVEVDAAADDKAVAEAKETPEDEANETPADEAKEENDNNAAMAVLEATVQALSDKLDGLVEAIAALTATNMNENKVALSAFSTEINELKSHVKFMAKVPLEASKTSKSNIVKDDRANQMLELGRMFKA